MLMKRVLALSLWLSGLCSCATSLGIQSGPENGGDSVAGGISFDPIRNVLYVSGATTGAFFGPKDPSSTNCFLGTVDLGSPDSPWSSRQLLGNPNVPETCAALMRIRDTDKLFVAGGALEGGVLFELRARGSLKATVYGMLIEMDLATTNDDNAFVLKGGNLMHESQVQYPISMTQDTEFVYVASVVSEDGNENSFYVPLVPQSYGYGSMYSVLVERYSATDMSVGSSSLRQTLRRDWGRTIGTEVDVFVGGLLYMSGMSLVLAGSTKGTDSAIQDINAGDDFDGFVTELNPTNGSLTSFSYRIESQPGRNEKVFGVCKQDGDESVFYVVGLTTGNLEGTDDRDPTEQAFLMKLSVVTSSGFNLEWVRQLGFTPGGGTSGIQGIACAVTSDGAHVYMVGRVDSGAVVSGSETPSAGGTDIFIMQFETGEGLTNYVRQFGTVENDYVTDVVTDADGNALVYGTTPGSLYRDNVEHEQDIFLLSVSRTDGTYDAPIKPGVVPMPTAPTPTTGTTAPAPTPTTTAPAPTTTTTAPAPAPTQETTTNSAGESDSDSSSDEGKGGKIALSLIIVMAVVFAALFVARRRRSKNVYSDEDHVVEYLKGFDDVEVDLKHSATGGWHGTYLNPRYASNDNYSYNYNSDGIDTSVRFEANNDYVRDSLFMDDYETPSLGVGEEDNDVDERLGLTKQRSNYSGLVDAYNTTWDDLSPHVMPTSRSSFRSPSQRDLSDKKHVMETIDFMRDDDAWGQEII